MANNNHNSLCIRGSRDVSSLFVKIKWAKPQKNQIVNPLGTEQTNPIP